MDSNSLLSIIRDTKRELGEIIADIDSVLDTTSTSNQDAKNVEVQEPVVHQPCPQTCTLTKQDKLNLFRGMFQCRQDRYAKRYFSNATQRHGYSPVCSNLWARGICPKVDNNKFKCDNCNNRSLSPITDDVLSDHLCGKHVIGVYPLHENNKTKFLALDFDKANWRADVLSVWQICEELEIECLVEVSQSGNGAHLWIFFTDLVEAHLARKLGTKLIAKAMKSNLMLSLDSFDRMFPNQDMLPHGDFGNLIALPLQYESIQGKGTTMFVDAQLNPFPLSEQWSILQGVKRVTPYELANDFGLSEYQGKKVEVTDRNGNITEEFKPWDYFLPTQSIQPSKKLNTEITVTLKNLIYIPMKTSRFLLEGAKRLGTINNPKFFKDRAAGLSTYNTSRFLCFAEVQGEYLSIPRGLLPEFIDMAKGMGVKVNVDDKTQQGRPLNKGVKFKTKLRNDQQEAFDEVLKHNYCMLKGATAFGKTVLSLATIIERKVNTLILVDTTKLAAQWKKNIDKFIGGTKYGSYFNSKNQLTGKIDVAVYKSMLAPKDANNPNGIQLKPEIFDYGYIVIDEAHKAGAKTYLELLETIHPKYILAVTATPYRADGKETQVFMQTGGIKYVAKEAEDANHSKYLFKKDTDSRLPLTLTNGDDDLHIADVYAHLMNDEKRNELIISDIQIAVKARRHPIVLTQRKEHARALVAMLNDLGVTTALQIGQMRAKEQREEDAKVNTAQVIVATGRYLGDGFDKPELDTLFQVLPISWKGISEQYGGRLNRGHESKDNIIIVDYVDPNIAMANTMFKRRKTGYNKLKFKLVDVSLDEFIGTNAEQIDLSLE
ncbi:DEAD/DEAH box helicase [Vibrio crassostreae]|uniref:DEAD/DEAH box helicase n=1 Tax=Vibrio crassostreae TaxID=246167 RepID=UPI001B30A246|nr:DEAD/DEAH box helicase [Vibrio crassostreae]